MYGFLDPCLYWEGTVSFCLDDTIFMCQWASVQHALFVIACLAYDKWRPEVALSMTTVTDVSDCDSLHNRISRMSSVK